MDNRPTTIRLSDLATSVRLRGSSPILRLDSEATARSILKRWEFHLAAWARKMGAEHLELHCPGRRKPFRVKATLGENQPLPNEDDEIFVEGQRKMSDLLGADYLKVLDFLQDQQRAGNIVIITSNITRDDHGLQINTDNPVAGRDICHHTSHLLLPSRAFWSAHSFTGYNYRLSWRRDRNDYEHLNPEYQRLKDLLVRDGMVRDYEYTLYRPDGALCRYSTSYFLCRDYCGDEVRIGVSRPQDWQLLEAVNA